MLISNTFNPLLPSGPCGARLAKKKIYFNLRRDHQKNSFERCDIESVNEKSVS